jgi:hypothetical protein
MHLGRAPKSREEVVQKIMDRHIFFLWELNIILYFKIRKGWGSPR